MEALEVIDAGGLQGVIRPGECVIFGCRVLLGNAYVNKGLSPSASTNLVNPGNGYQKFEAIRKAPLNNGDPTLPRTHRYAL